MNLKMIEELEMRSLSFLGSLGKVVGVLIIGLLKGVGWMDGHGIRWIEEKLVDFQFNCS